MIWCKLKIVGDKPTSIETDKQKIKQVHHQIVS